jgi:thiol:disulfide interchange protein
MGIESSLEERQPRWLRTKPGGSFMVTALVVLAFGALVFGGVLLPRTPYSFAVLSLGILLGILARVAQAALQHHEQMEAWERMQNTAKSDQSQVAMHAQAPGEGQASPEEVDG